MHGQPITTIKLGKNEITVYFKTIITVEIGKEIMYAIYPGITNTGLVFGESKLYFSDELYVYYPSQKLKACVKIGTDERVDQVTGGIYRSEKNDYKIDIKTLAEDLFPKKNLSKFKCLSSCSGITCENFYFDGKKYWDNKEEAYSP